MEQYTIVKCTSQNKLSWGLQNNKLYAVETNEDIVEAFKDDYIITVWNDDGHLAEMNQGEFEIVAVDKVQWFEVRPDSIFVEQF